ncbi:MAG: hypothetical protein IGS03_10705 [Candidatus Sericytochromatia bacterium]|nr:hypothetical protein [Candidatus Sericytochromatia bacterium]
MPKPQFICTFLLASALSLVSAKAQACPPDQHTQHPLRQTLLALLAADQADRQLLTDQGLSQLTPEDVARIQHNDSARLQQLMALLKQHGWPSRSMVCADGVQAAFVLVQHADAQPAFQMAMLKDIKAAYAAGEIPGQALALLTDRVLKNTGQPQRYGTQVLIKANQLEVYPLEAPEQVDERRASLGLPPLADYLAQLRAFYKLGTEALPDAVLK